jgi:hypothetical protein
MYATGVSEYLEGGFTDTDMIMGANSADWIDKLWNCTNTLYDKHPFHPEQMLRRHMITKSIRPFSIPANVTRCSSYGNMRSVS